MLWTGRWYTTGSLGELYSGWQWTAIDSNRNGQQSARSTKATAPVLSGTDGVAARYWVGGVLTQITLKKEVTSFLIFNVPSFSRHFSQCPLVFNGSPPFQEFTSLNTLLIPYLGIISFSASTMLQRRAVDTSL